MSTTTATETFTREQAKAHDTVTVELLRELQKVERQANYALDRIHDEAGDRKVNVSKRYGYSNFVWQFTDEEAIAKVVALATDPRANYRHLSADTDDDFLAYIGQEAQKKLDEYQAAIQEAHNLNAQIETQEAVFYAQRWSRFEVVPGGHIHNRNATCHTLRPTTRVAWIASLSGDSEADAVEQYGPALCSHCFKNAPVEWQQKAKVQKTTDSRGEIQVITLAEAQKIADEKAAKKAEREAKKTALEARRAQRG